MAFWRSLTKRAGSGPVVIGTDSMIRIRTKMSLPFIVNNYFFQMPATFWLATATGTGSMWPCLATTARSSGSSSVPPSRYGTQPSENFFWQCSGSATYVFGPPGSTSGSVINLYGSGSDSESFHQPAKKLWKTFDFVCFVTSLRTSRYGTYAAVRNFFSLF